MRNVFVLVCGMMMSVSVSAATCIGGTMITGKDPNRSFCISDRLMNWWSAHQWCVGNGRVLVHPDNLCNYNGYGWFIGDLGCPNFKGFFLPNSAWTSLALSEENALWLQFNNIFISYPRSAANGLALCE